MNQSQHTYPLFPDLLLNQKKSVLSFWEKGLIEEFELFSYVTGKKKNLHMIFHGAKFFVQKPFSSFDEILKHQKTYSVSLFVPIEIQSHPSTGGPLDRSAVHAAPVEVSGSSAQKDFVTSLNTKVHSMYHLQQSNLFSSKNSLESHSAAGNAQTSQKLFPVYFGEIPLMTERGNFFINGSARVLVNQIVRCPSVYFKVKLDTKNRRTYIASFLSEYGSWLRLETDYKNRIWARIDKSQRISIYALLRVLGFPESFLRYQLKYYSFLVASQEEYFPEQPHDAIQYLWKKLTPGRWNSLQGCYSFFYNKFFHPRKYSIGQVGRIRLNKRLSRVSVSNSQVVSPGSEKTDINLRLSTLTPEDIFFALDLLIQFHYGEGILDDIDHLKNRRVRLPGELMQNQLRLALSRLTQTAAEKLSKLELVRTENQNLENRVTPSFAGFPAPSSLNLPYSQAPVSDELETKSSVRPFHGHAPSANTDLNFFTDSTREEMNSIVHEMDNPRGFLASGASAEAVSTNKAKNTQRTALKQILQTQLFGSSFRELFHTSQLSQYMDQTNPLAEITHKRRLSSLGPGGIGRDQAGFAVREIHPSHFGRICPIETPEGPNAGLVGSLATYAQITPDGFLESPYFACGESPGPFSPPSSVFSKFDLSNLKLSNSKLAEPSIQQDWFVFSADVEDESYISAENFQRMPQDLGPSVDKPDSRVKLLSGPSLSHVHEMDKYPVRYKQEFLTVERNQIQYYGVSPIQMISIATSLIPFLEHDDANRALMGSNMQRQAVPVLFAEKPFVGTGLEIQAARDSSTLLLAKQSGQVVFVDAREIRISREPSVRDKRNLTSTAAFMGPMAETLVEKNPLGLLPAEEDSLIYDLQHYLRSNQNTCLRQTPRVNIGEWVEKGDLLADGSATYNGEIALGKNILVAYLPWEGYNFEDAIVINERLVQEDVYTSIHIDRYDVEIRETDHGKEEITRDLNFLSFGKIQTTPSLTFSNLSASSDVGRFAGAYGEGTAFEGRTSFGAFPGAGTFAPLSSNGSQTGGDGLPSPGSAMSAQSSPQGDAPFHKGSHAGAEPYTFPPSSESNSFDEISPNGVEHLDERGIIFPGTWVEEGDILVGKITPISPPKPTPEYRLLLAIFETKPLPFKDTSLRVPAGVEGRVLDCVCLYGSKAKGHEIPLSSSSQIVAEGAKVPAPGHAPNTEGQTNPIEKVQVFLAHKRKIQLGDKMSGRHGNKGIVSLILPPQDMPFLQDGTPVDIVLNPLGVPSRMNVGQVLECLFGLAAKYLNQYYRLLAFDELYGLNASRGLVYQKLFEAAQKTKHQWLFDPNTPGKSHLFDGRTGEAFLQPILVGYSYMFKLIHLVDEKIHARSTGPYSLVTQQPLGGRSKHGGQRLGEMEVWALEGYGAASILHEFLTLKSDDIDARNTFLFHLMKRKQFPQERLRRCLPESFRVLVHELQSLCLSVYYNPDFRLTYPSLLGWDGLFLLSSKKFPSLRELSDCKIA